MSASCAEAVSAIIVVRAGTTAADAIAERGGTTTGPTGAVMVKETTTGQLRDLAWVPESDTEVEPVAADTEEGRAVIRHSCAHVAAQAVQQLFPGTLLGIGPPVENGFYYDFLPQRPFTSEDVGRIEARMQQIIKAGQRFDRRVTTVDDARKELAHERFKLELIDLKASSDDTESAAEGASVEVGGGELTMYDNLDARSGDRVWTDLCRGPHVPTTRFIPAFKLMRSAAAYWRGSEKNPQLQRIYGTAWESRDALKEHLRLLEEAAKRDHRKLGAELDLFSFPDEVGSGLAVFHPKGGIIRREMEGYSRQRHQESGYEFVNSPHITKSNLFETSGHLGWYAESMYPPMEMEGTQYYLKPMNCPFHNLIFKARGRSYRELPLRLFEFGTVYRYEKSGVVHGLTRVRGMTQDDAHIYCTKDQLAGELKSLLGFVIELLRDYGLHDFYLELSARDDSEKFIGEPAQWEEATEALAQAASDSGLALVPDPGGAAFYGPKISVQAKDAIGRTWQMSTIQVDFNLPRRFQLEYQSADGTRQQPVMIHRALFGSIERFFGVLTEHYAGAFPAWLAPVQVVGIPIADSHTPYLEEFVTQLRERGIRAQMDTADERMQKKIRNAQQQKVPFMAIAGEDDVAAGAVSFRYRDGSQRNGVPISEAIDHVVEVVASRSNAGPSAP